MDGMRGWLVGAGPPDPSLTRFSDVNFFLIRFYYLKPVLIWPVLGTEEVGARYKSSLQINCPVLVPIIRYLIP
jgi:hypothetical protein